MIEPSFRFSATMLLGLIGMVFNLVIPGAVGGDLIKAAYLVRMRIRKTQAVASMVIDRVVGLLGLFILAAIAGGFAWQLAPTDVRKLITAAWVAVGLGVFALLLIFSRVLTRMFPQLKGGHSRLGLVISELSEMSTTYSGRLDVVVGATALSVWNHALNVVAFYLIGRLLSPDDDHDARPALSDGSLDALQHGCTTPIWRPWPQRGSGPAALQAGGTPSGAWR